MKKLKFNWRKWLDDFVLAGKGILLATREKRFWIGFIVAFVFFGTLMNLMGGDGSSSGGATNFQAMAVFGFPENLKVIGKAFIGIFGIGVPFQNWILVFFISLLQGTLIGLLVLLWNKKKKNSENVQRAGIVTGLIALGAGCPTCGTTLLTPIIGMFVSGSSFAVAGVVSWIVTTLAVIVAIFSLKRMGLEMYAIIINEKYLAKKSKKAKKAEESDGNIRKEK